MIAKTYILQNLDQLDVAFRKAKNPKYATYFSKLAILELCGWIEMSMDQVILEHCSNSIRLPKNTKVVAELVKRNYGFEYDGHFRKMLLNLIGMAACEKLETKMDVAVLAKFEAQLGSLKTMRNSLAHTYLKGSPATFKIDAPSVTRSRFNDIYVGLKAFQIQLKAL